MKSYLNSEIPLRVLQVVQCLEIGGLESMVIELSCQLKKKGVYVELLCLNEVDAKYVENLDKNFIPISVIHEKSFLNINFARKFLSFIRRGNFDIVHAHSGCHLNSAIFAKLSGVHKFVYTAHGLPVFTGLRDRIEDTIAACMSSEIVSVSHEINDFLQKWFVTSRCKYTTIINGINTEKYIPLSDRIERQKFLQRHNLPNDKILFCSVGRLTPVKNYSMVLRALKCLVDAGITNICFVLIGEGEQQQYLVELSKKLNISDYVYFLGMQYEIHQFLPFFTFFVLSSLTEGTSISLLESQSCGLPAVATNVGGNSSVIIHSENGFLCQPNDVEKMAKCMNEIINNHELSIRMSESARKRIKSDFSVDNMTEKYLDVYNRQLC